MTKTRTKLAADIASGSAVTGPIQVRREGGKIWSHVRKKWLIETPEEAVRQQFLAVLVNEYGYAIEQIDEELSVVGRGAAQARADFAIWVTAEDKAKNKSPLIVVECKADNVTIRDRDYEQGDHYARLADAKFFVTHNWDL
jgi:type I restriction enzyme M protein